RWSCGPSSSSRRSNTCCSRCASTMTGSEAFWPVTVGLAIGFGKSDNLAAAYGIAARSSRSCRISGAEARFGFMDRPHIPEFLTAGKSLGCTVDLDDVTYYVGHETVIGREDGRGLPGWQEAFFAVVERNAVHVSDFFSLPSDQVVKIGRQVSIQAGEAAGRAPPFHLALGLHPCNRPRPIAGSARG